MSVRTRWIAIGLAAVLVVLAGSAGALPGRAAPQGIVAGNINYQGRLTDPDGTPLSGTFPMRFQIYDDATVGTNLWDSGDVNVEVDHGLFNVALSVDPTSFNGQALWLRIHVNGEWLSPRQELLPVPYALGLRPGAVIEGEPTGWTGHVLRVNMDGSYPVAQAVLGSVATGQAVRGDAPGGYGLLGYTEEGYAVYGLDAGSEQARGYGGYFDSANGIGVYGHSDATSTGNNLYAPGVYGDSTHGVGVYGLSESTNPGIRGESTDGPGVYGTSTNDIGVYGRTSGQTTADYGVYGWASGLGYGVYGYQSADATGGLGVYGKNEGGGSGVSGLNAGDGNGTWGYSTSYNGVGGATNRADSNYGLYTVDNLYSANFHSLGAVMHIVQNGGDEPLEMGDVVAIAGLGASPAEGLPAAIQVHKANTANSPAVIGVVASNYPAEWLTDPASIDPTGATGPVKPIPETRPGPIAPGEYLLVVVQGPCQVKAEAVVATIQPGDLLSSGRRAGYAAKAQSVTIDGVTMAVPGTVLGKALEALDGGQKLLSVYVTLQ